MRCWARAGCGGAAVTQARAAAIAMVFALGGIVVVLAGAFAFDKMTSAPAAPTCHAYCDVIVRGALSRSEGPLPHDCRFFAECGCGYQCPPPAP